MRGGQAKETLQEVAQKKLKSVITKSKDKYPRIVWWDAGGNLKPVIEEACDELSLTFLGADEGRPLSLREKTLDKRNESQVWYIPEPKNGRQWFKDVKETGGELQLSAHQLAADIYEGIKAWDIYDGDVESDEYQDIAEILREKLTKKGYLPTFQDLQSEIITQGKGRPLEHILKNGWDQFKDDSDTLKKIKEKLIERGLELISDEDKFEDVVEKARKWAVAEWMVSEGLDVSELPQSLKQVGTTLPGTPVLKEVLTDNKNSGLEEIFLESYLKEVVDDIDDKDIWNIGSCPVDGALESRLWKDWKRRLDEKDFEELKEDVDVRHRTVRDTYGENAAITKVWFQAKQLTSLAQQYEKRKELNKEEDLIDSYCDRNSGFWKIDQSVRKIIISGEPENKLEIDHNSSEDLKNIREKLVEKRYMEYIQRLSEHTRDLITEPSFFKDNKQAFHFWEDNKEELASGESTAVFYLDALRYELSRELAEKLREDGLEVSEETRIGMLPSDTEFGMAAVTPGRPETFELKMQNGDLVPMKSKRKIKTTGRNDILEKEGWEIKQEKRNWTSTRIAYFDQELDDIGEKGMSEIERKLENRVSQLAELISEKVKKGGLERAFVVADHGFVLLPKKTDFSRISSNEDAETVTRRYVAGDQLERMEYGIKFEESDLPYLQTKVITLVDPFERFRKQGISDSRFYHGGALPQEFILNFLVVKQE